MATRQVLEEVGNFILRQHLPVTPVTLCTALDCVMGSNEPLVRAIAERRHRGEPITHEWLAEARELAANEEFKGLTELTHKIERSVSEFGRTTRDARNATTDYRMVLRGHVDELTEVNNTGAAISELAAVARAMLERTHQIEHQMARSERETKALQRSLDEARRNADLDHLTGLPNRRAFEGLFEAEIAAARRENEQLCVAFCDIDRFKAINDAHGHDAGDRVLRLVARTLAEISDDKCHVARHGGEEFVVLFRGKTTAEAFDILDKTRETLAQRRLVNRANDTPFGRVTFSAGLADVLAGTNPRAALKAADEALYAAKQSGRNRIVTAISGDALIQAA